MICSAPTGSLSYTVPELFEFIGSVRSPMEFVICLSEQVAISAGDVSSGTRVHVMGKLKVVRLGSSMRLRELVAGNRYRVVHLLSRPLAKDRSRYSRQS